MLKDDELVLDFVEPLNGTIRRPGRGLLKATNSRGGARARGLIPALWPIICQVCAFYLFLGRGDGACMYEEPLRKREYGAPKTSNFTCLRSEATG